MVASLTVTVRITDVRFESHRTSRYVRAMSAHPEADMCSAQADVRFVPKADIPSLPANDPKPTLAIGQSVVSGDALDILGQHFAWHQITDIS